MPERRYVVRAKQKKAHWKGQLGEVRRGTVLWLEDSDGYWTWTQGRCPYLFETEEKARRAVTHACGPWYHEAAAGSVEVLPADYTPAVPMHWELVEEL